MLFFYSRTSEHNVDGLARLHLLEQLQGVGLMPLIRSVRLYCFEQALQGTEHVKEMERAVAAWTETEENSLYIRGDLFCVEDYVLFLIFGGAKDELSGMRAGIIYGRETIEAERKLDAFCRRVTEAVEAIRGGAPRDDASTQGPVEWKANVLATDKYAAQVSKEDIVERHPALEALEDSSARRLLYRIEEAHDAGRVAELLASEAENQALINRLVDAGLLKREVLVSCRQTGLSLLRLPSVEMLSIITASNAMCHACDAALSDEKVEELVMLTPLASSSLADSAWLVNRLRSVLHEIGIREESIRSLPSSGEGEIHLLVSVSNEPFLFVLVEGDLTATHAARALDKLIDTESQHLVVIATSRIQEDTRVRLREHARRRARAGREVEVVLIEGMDTAASELHHAFERAWQRALAAELCELDASLGFSAGYMVATRFRLVQRTDAQKNLAESSVGA